MEKMVTVETLRGLADKLGVFKEKEVEHEGIKINVKQYLPVEEKRVIAELVTLNAFVDEENLYIRRFDFAIKEALLGYSIAKHYTNLQPMNDPFEMYDLLVSTKLLDVILSNIPESELRQLEEIVDERIAEEHRLQEITNTLGYKLEDTLNTLNRNMEEAINTIFNFDPKQLTTLTQFLTEEQKAELGIEEETKPKNKKGKQKSKKETKQEDKGEVEE